MLFAADDTGAQKKPFDIVSLIEVDGKLSHFFGRKSGTFDVIATSIDTVGTVINAVIGKKYLEQ